MAGPGPHGEGGFRAEAGRLPPSTSSQPCPWAQSTANLPPSYKGSAPDLLSHSWCTGRWADQGWTFGQPATGVIADPIQARQGVARDLPPAPIPATASRPVHCSGLRKTGQIVKTESSESFPVCSTVPFMTSAADPGDYYPGISWDEIDSNQPSLRTVNNGSTARHLPTTQEALRRAIQTLFRHPRPARVNGSRVSLSLVGSASTKACTGACSPPWCALIRLLWGISNATWPHLDYPNLWR